MIRGNAMDVYTVAFANEEKFFLMAYDKQWLVSWRKSLPLDRAIVLAIKLTSGKMIMLNLPVLPPLISLCIPPALKAEAQAIAAQEPMVHPVWRKLEERGRHFLVRTNDIEDIEEMADWARSWLVETP
jgi:hypothetical protein